MSKKLKIHVKNGDTVKIITGEYKGKIGTIIKTIRKKNQVIVKDINMKVKHIRPRQEGETGKIIRQERPIHSSNVMLYDINEKIASRYKKNKDEFGKLNRILIKLEKTK
uniref:Large ribosomal subunit protein uL24c n=1 Tax=Dichotomaria marginata TaxID=268567 RepID=A0A1G4NSF7_9FLOR|nr:Ribosomal protein L24 [Dichotomaria marginata]SCW21603.1 Ribosomal protein L24 [Dichotomaria marginata]